MELAVDGLKRQGKATPYDVVVSEALAEVLTGDGADMTETVSEDKLYAAERKAFLRLVKDPRTLGAHGDHAGDG